MRIKENLLVIEAQDGSVLNIRLSNNTPVTYPITDENEEKYHLKFLFNKIKEIEELENRYISEESETFERNFKAFSEKISPDACYGLKERLTDLINFFSEFNFTPNYRFTNTFSRCSKKNDYVFNYFRLIDSPYSDIIKDKMKSEEWKRIVKDFPAASTPVNNRFKIFYGAQGTGKTTKAFKETSHCIVCNSSMTPADLMEDFTFSSGNPTFKRSLLREAMENGYVLILDEMNLLPFESVRFLQGILDGKKTFSYKGEQVTIHDNFRIIGTMNLVVNGMTFALPEPLVDRASELKEFNLDAELLMEAFK